MPCAVEIYLSFALNIANLRRFCVEAIKEANCLPETFSAILIPLQKEAAGRHITTGDRQSGKIVRILEKARLLKRKAEILWRFDLQKYNLGFIFRCDWRAKRFLPLQIFLSSNPS